MFEESWVFGVKHRDCGDSSDDYELINLIYGLSALHSLTELLLELPCNKVEIVLINVIRKTVATMKKLKNFKANFLLRVIPNLK